MKGIEEALKQIEKELIQLKKEYDKIAKPHSVELSDLWDEIKQAHNLKAKIDKLEGLKNHMGQINKIYENRNKGAI